MPLPTQSGCIQAVLAGLSLVIGCSRASAPAPSDGPKTDDERAFYALGMDFAHHIEVLTPSPAELEMLKAGLTDVATKQALKVDLESMQPKIAELAQRRKEAVIEAESQRGRAYLDKVAQEPGAQRLSAGLVLKSLRAGTGRHPDASDTVKVNFEGRLIDGTVFESVSDPHQPRDIALLNALSCWRLGIPHLKVGEKAKLICPPELAYGEGGVPPKIPGGATLEFEIELLEALPAPPAPSNSPPRPTPPPAL